MRRSALLILVVAQAILWILAMSAVASIAADCPNKWDDPQHIVGKGATENAARTDFEANSKGVFDQADCTGKTCAAGSGRCRKLRLASPTCTGDDEKGWTCEGSVRVGCFCLGHGETGHVGAKPSNVPPPTTVTCSNSFGNPTDAIGVSDKSQAQAMTAHDNKVKEYIAAAAKTCASYSCTGAKKSCRLYYTTTRPKCKASKDPDFPGWACQSQFRSGCFCLGDNEGKLAMAAGAGLPAGEEFAAAPARRPYRGRTMLVGVVLAEGCSPNHTCTASLVTHPEVLAGTPGLVVRKVRVPEHRDSRGHATLIGQVVSTEQAKRQPADGPITFTPAAGEAASALALEVALASRPDETVTVPVTDLPQSRSKPTEKASAPPVLPDNGVCVVHDRFSGNGHATEVKVNGTAVPVLAESPEMAVFRPGSAANAGENEVTISDGGIKKTYRLTAPSVSISADQTTLRQNQSARFKVVVTDVLGVPDGSWSSTGSQSQGEAIGGKGGPPTGGKGYLRLTIKNDSPNTTTMNGGNLITVPLYQHDFTHGNYTYEGTITAQQPGPFQIEAILDPFLAEAPPVRIAGERPPVAENPQGKAPIGCCQYSNPASGRWCAMETEVECLGRWMSPNFGCNQQGICGVNLPLGGDDKNRSKAEPSPGSLLRPPSRYSETLEEPHGEPGKAPPVEIPPIALVPDSPLGASEHAAENDCPQRRDGCLALIINFLREKPKPIKFKGFKVELAYDFSPPGSKDPVAGIPESLRALGCDVQEAVAQFDPVPQPITIELLNSDITIPPIPEAVDAAVSHNKREWGKVDLAVLDHREKIQKDHEVVLEFVVAHGGDREDWGDCGAWGMDFPIGGERDGLRRWPIHLANYWLGRKHMCDWAVFDGSCFSGLTPQAVDELENFSFPGKCGGPKAIDCPQHAGWEGDFATGSAPSTVSCMSLNLILQLDDVRHQLRIQRAKHDASPANYDYADLVTALRTATNTFIDFSNGTKGDWKPRPSYYQDGGYYGDRSHPHHGSSGYPGPKTKKEHG